MNPLPEPDPEPPMFHLRSGTCRIWNVTFNPEQQQSRWRKFRLWLASLFVVLALAHSAHAILVVNDISGDQDSIHGEFTLTWSAPNEPISRASGDLGVATWGMEGQVLRVGSPNHQSGNHLFYFFADWDDGLHLGSFLFRPFNFGGTGSWDFSHRETLTDGYIDIYGAFSFAPDRSGTALINTDIVRTSTNTVARLLVIEKVPDNGNTIALFCLALCGISFIRGWQRAKCYIPSTPETVR